MFSISDAPIQQLALLAVACVVLGTISGLLAMVLTMWWKRRKERADRKRLDKDMYAEEELPGSEWLDSTDGWEPVKGNDGTVLGFMRAEEES